MQDALVFKIYIFICEFTFLYSTRPFISSAVRNFERPSSPVFEFNPQNPTGFDGKKRIDLRGEPNQMVMDPKTWQDVILSIIRNLADQDYQERVWVRGIGPEMDSLTEAYCRLFDDNDFEGFISYCASDAMISEHTLSRPQELRDALNSFEFDENQPDAIAINTSGWHKICELAKETLSDFPDHS